MTTPFVNQRWFFAQAGISGLIYQLNGIVLCTLWLLLRIMFCAWTVFTPATRTLFGLEGWRSKTMMACFCGGYALQWFWGYKLFRGLLKALGYRRASKKAQ